MVFVRQTARATKAAVGTPAYVYDAATLKSNAEACLAFPHAYGLTVRYAMKSLPNKAVLQLFNRCNPKLQEISVFWVLSVTLLGAPTLFFLYIYDFDDRPSRALNSVS